MFGYAVPTPPFGVALLFWKVLNLIVRANARTTPKRTAEGMANTKTELHSRLVGDQLEDGFRYW